MGLNVTIKEIDGSILVLHLEGTFKNASLNHDLKMSMDGNYAVWVGDGPIEIGSDVWGDLVFAIDAFPDVAAAIELYNNGK